MSEDSDRCERCNVRGHSVFCDLNGEELAEMSEAKVIRRFQKGDTVYFFGDNPAGVYCLRSGTVKVYRAGADGRDQILRLAKAGEIIGYRALLGGQPHANTASAMEDAEICFIPRSLFFTLAERSLRLSRQVLAVLSAELLEAEEQIVAMAQRSVRERLAESLILLGETYGYEADGATLLARLTRAEIASLVGAAPESVIRLMAEFNRDGIIDTSGRRIRIVDRDALLSGAALPQ